MPLLLLLDLLVLLLVTSPPPISLHSRARSFAVLLREGGFRSAELMRSARGLTAAYSRSGGQMMQ
jgi:hypothetical protein